jgi:phosphoglycolate phosphatase
MILGRYRHIIWDWNGTLLDDVDLTIDVMNGILQRRGLPLMDKNRYHAVFDFPVQQYYGRIGLDNSDASFKELSVEFISHYERRRLEAMLHDGCEALLDAIRDHGATQSILSAYPHQTLCQIVGHFGLTPKFVRLTGLDNIYAHSKAALGRQCVAELGIPPQEVLLIGDTLHDFDVAREIGVDCVLVAHGHHSAERLRAKGSPVFENLGELARHLGVSLHPAAESPAGTAGQDSPGGSASPHANR